MIYYYQFLIIERMILYCDEKKYSMKHFFQLYFTQLHSLLIIIVLKSYN